MPYSLKDRVVLVTGGSRGLGALICERFAKEGCHVAINYNASADRAAEVASAVKKHGVRATVVQADMALEADCRKVVEHAKRELGGIDIVVHNAGWTRISDFNDLDALAEAEWDKCFAINAKAVMHLTRAAMPTFNANPEGGAVIVTSSIAGTGPIGSSLAYSTSKCAANHLVQCLAAGQGPKLRINAVLPGLLLTEWGNKFPDEKIESSIQAATLKKVADLEDTVEMYVTIAKNSSMTGERVRIDSGLFIR